LFSKSLDSLLKAWRENPFTAECAKFAEIFFCILRVLSVLGGEKLGFENAMAILQFVLDGTDSR
jgi:hypothetical protein